MEAEKKSFTEQTVQNKALLSQLKITGITPSCVLECPFVVDLNRAEKLGAC